MLIQQKNNKYIFIDFEYSSYNYPIYDIANYFTEFEFNYDVKNPPFFGINKLPENIQELRERFIRNYVIAKNKTFEEYKKSLSD